MLNPADFLSRHATPISKLSKAQVKETPEFEKTVWFLQFPPYTECMSRIIMESEKDDIIRELNNPTERDISQRKRRISPSSTEYLINLPFLMKN